MRILLVEDDVKISSFITKGLKESGFIVMQADNGADGLSLALGESF
ncbi:MAG: DNA-binding response regulator, partial [Desulfofustis sp.]|nr:DNA-binding response regulator [Desulfofustis sp.]